jgi:hypothetical protein
MPFTARWTCREKPDPCLEGKDQADLARDRYGIRAVATLKLSTHIDWSTGEPSPMYGAIRNWLNCSAG